VTVPAAAEPPLPATLGAAARALRARFAQAGIADAALEARLLVAAASELEPQDVVLDPDRKIDPAAGARLARFLDARLAGMPVGRILGQREFWGLSFRLSADTLEPRPDTETLVEAALEWVDATGGRARRLRLADIGTGTGAIAVALLHELPNAVALACDLSANALSSARENARSHGVGDRLLCFQGDFAAALAPGLDLVLSNPPYIALGEAEALAREVRLHDPALALFAGDDGLDAYRAILPDAARALCRNGALFVEIGWRQGADVSDLLVAAGFEEVTLRQDLAGRDRVLGGVGVAKTRQPASL
jgi:release factor glutamine methyltransferase